MWTSGAQSLVENVHEITKVVNVSLGNELEKLTTIKNERVTDAESKQNLYNNKLADSRVMQTVQQNLNYYAQYMNEQLLRDIRSMLVTNKLQVNLDADASRYPPPYVNQKKDVVVHYPRYYWKYVSYDGNLYVVLD